MFVLQVAKAIFLTLKRLFQRDDATDFASVELWVVMTTVLLVFRFLLDFFGPWYSSAFTLTAVQIIELLNYSMVHYTLGLMQLSGKKVINDYFQAWAVLMVSLQYSVKIGRPYGRSKRIPLLDLMSSFWAANLLRVQTVYLLKIPLWFIWSINAFRIIAYFLFADRWASSNMENARLICDYMMYEHTLSDTTNTDSMVGYKYLILGENKQDMKLDIGKFRLKLDLEHAKLITVEKLWGLHDSALLGRTADPDDRLKDVCLSFALYKLLRRRFYDLPLHEAEHDKTKKLIFEGIFKDKDDGYERVFRVTGVELSFLQDSYHSKHAQMFASGFPFHSLLLSLILVALTGYIIYPVRQIPHRIDSSDLQGNRITHGVLITYFVVALIIAKEIAEIIMYVFSQWTMVQMICMHMKYPRFGHCWLVVKAMRCMFRLIRKGKWKNKICQYNILISSRPWKLLMTRLSPTSINLETEVLKAIFESFKGLQQINEKAEEDLETEVKEKGLEQNPERSEAYFLNAFRAKGDLMQQLEWAIDLEADTHRILVWHIATCLCEINLSDNAYGLKTFWLKSRPFVDRSTAPEGVWEHYITASSLSNYCGYLLTNALVPDNGLVVKFVFNEVLRETNRSLKPGMFISLFDIYNSLMRKARVDKKPKDEEPVQEPMTMGDDHIITEQIDGGEDGGEDGEEDGEEDGDEHFTADAIVNEHDPENGVEAKNEDPDTIIKMGTRLGKQLIETYGTDRVGLWSDLAKFWTGFLLHLAANTGAMKHKTHLSGSGELITHLWALLSHAGILGNSHGELLLDPVNLANINAANRDMADTTRYPTFSN